MTKRRSLLMAGSSNPRMHQALRIRSRLIAPMVTGIRKRLSAEPPAVLEQVVASLVHMFINRLFYANPRENELVVYQLLAKHFTRAGHRQSVSPYPSSALQEA